MPHLSASTASRWIACPGSARLCAKIPRKEREVNKYSLQGDAAHELGRMALQTGDRPQDWAGKPIYIQAQKADGVNQVILDSADCAAVFTYWDYVRRRTAELNGVMALEEWLNPGSWFNREDMKCRADCVINGPDAIEVVDYKHGSSPKGAFEAYNPQNLMYAFGASARVDWVNAPVKKLYMTIVQPRAPHPQGPIRRHEISPGELFGIELEKYKAHVAATDDPEAVLIPGEDQCRYCPAKTICPKLTGQVEETLKPPAMTEQEKATVLQGSNLSADQKQAVTESLYPEKYHNTGTWDAIETNLGRPTDQLSLKAKVQIMEMEAMVSGWFKAIREEVTELAKNGTEIPNYKLVASTTHRKWSLNDKEIIQKLANLKGIDGAKIPKKDVMKETPLSIAQAEKLIKPRVTERVWRNIEKIVIKPGGKPTLVPLTDPREPIKTAQDVFKPQEPELPWS